MYAEMRSEIVYAAFRSSGFVLLYPPIHMMLCLLDIFQLLNDIGIAFHLQLERIDIRLLTY